MVKEAQKNFSVFTKVVKLQLEALIDLSLSIAKIAPSNFVIFMSDRFNYLCFEAMLTFDFKAAVLTLFKLLETFFGLTQQQSDPI